jgi:hypothetical protein
MRPVVQALRTFQQTAGPAGTLLIITVLLMIATSFARAMPVFDTDADWTTIVAHTPERVAPGTAFDVAVQIDAQRDLKAYLPGLNLERVPLRYDARRDVHVAEVDLPWYAPPRGHFTLRIVDDDGLEMDVQLALAAPSQS